MVLLSNSVPVARFKDHTDREMESPLDVLSRAASLIRQEEARNKIEGEKDGNSDSGFEDNPSPISKSTGQTEKVDTAHKEKARTSPPGGTIKKESDDDTVCRKEARCPVELALKENSLLIQNTYGMQKWHREIFEKSNNCRGRQKSTEVHRYHEVSGTRGLHVDRQTTRPTSPQENETRESVIKTPVTASGFNKYPPSSHTSPSHYGYSLLPHYVTPLPIMSRPSVITAAGCPSVFKGQSLPCCHCMQPSCCSEIKPIYPDRHARSRERHDLIPPGFESPTVDDHFKKSLGPVYDRLSPTSHHYDLKTTIPHTQASKVHREASPLAISKPLPHCTDMTERNKSDMYHQIQTSERIFRDYTIMPSHKRNHFRYDPVGRHSPEHYHCFGTPMKGLDSYSLKMEHQFLPRSLEEPGTVDDHFAKALGKIWFDVQVRNTEHAMRHHGKGLRVAHQ